MIVQELLNVTRDTTWLPWAVQYFFLIGLSVGCFFIALAAQRRGGGTALRVHRLALLGALTCGLAAPVALLADLHQPGRFWRFYTNPSLGSWMAWGAFFIPGYLAGLLVYAWAVLKPDLGAARGEGFLPRLRRLSALGTRPIPGVVAAAAVWTAAFAILVLLYTGMEVMVVRARPLWNTPLLPVQFAVTAVAGSLGLVLVFDRLFGQPDPLLARRVGRMLALSLVVSLAVGAVWFGLGVLEISETHARALASVAGYKSWRLTAFWSVAALVVPAIVALAFPVRLGWLAGLLAIHAAWMVRWTIFIGGQTIPKTGAGLYAYDLPLGQDGVLGIVGTGGLWLFLLILLSTLLPGHEPSERAESAATAPRHIKPVRI